MNLLKRVFGESKQPEWSEIIGRGAQIIDVRTPAEYRGGHVKGSKNIPLSDLGGHLEKLKKAGKPIITCCASGQRSGVAQRKMESLGMEAYNGGPWQRVAQIIQS